MLPKSAAGVVVGHTIREAATTIVVIVVGHTAEQSPGEWRLTLLRIAAHHGIAIGAVVVCIAKQRVPAIIVPSGLTIIARSAAVPAK